MRKEEDEPGRMRRPVRGRVYKTAMAPRTRASMPPDTRFIIPALVLGTEDEGSAELLGLAEVEAGVEGTEEELSVLVVFDSDLVEVVDSDLVVDMAVGVSLELSVLVEVDSSVVECEAVDDGVGLDGSPVAPATVKRGR